jgi:hypothetical protein
MEPDFLTVVIGREQVTAQDVREPLYTESLTC